MGRRAHVLIALAVFTAGSRAGAQSQTEAPAENTAPPALSAAPRVMIEDASERVSRATVTVLSGETPRALGVVLAVDGRIVTSLAALQGDRTLRVRYPDGRVDSASVVATDDGWGLALLQPSAGHWREGLALASRATGNMGVRWSTSGRDGPHSVVGALRRRRTFVGAGSELLRDAWELSVAPDNSTLGSGIANGAGELVGVIVPPDAHAGAGASPAPFGAPVAVVRDLVGRAGNTARPWLGLVVRAVRAGELEGAASTGGLLVTGVSTGSPAERSGLVVTPRADVVIAVGDQLVRTPADLAAALEGRRPGDVLVLRVARPAGVSDVAVELAPFPSL